MCFFLQRFHDEVKARQGVLDTVNEKAQALLKTNADAKLSHAITQLTTKYQAALSLCKVRISFAICGYYNFIKRNR